MARAERNEPIRFGNKEVAPGERVTLDIEVAKLYTHTQLPITVEIVHGKYAGPVLLVNAAIHGDELNGVEVVRQLLQKVDPTKLKGTLVAVPVVNVFGFIHKSRYLPDRRDLNRCFPGSERGSIAGRIAYQFFNRVVLKCTHIIDLHTAAIHRTNLPQIRANLANPETSAMATAFGTPVVIDAELRDGSLRSEAEKAGIPVITYEAGEALRFEPYAITAGVKGTLRVMRYLNMISARRISHKREPVIAKATRWIRADLDGILRSHTALGERVEKGQTLATICDPLGNEEIRVTSPQGGIVIGQQTLPLVNEGDAIFHIAFFQESDVLVGDQVESYMDDVKDDSDNDIRWGVAVS